MHSNAITHDSRGTFLQQHLQSRPKELIAVIANKLKLFVVQLFFFREIFEQESTRRIRVMCIFHLELFHQTGQYIIKSDDSALRTYLAIQL